MIHPTNRLSMRFPAQPLSTAEIRLLISACKSSSLGLRCAAMIALMAHGGLRCRECSRVRPIDCDLVSGTIRVLNSKRGRSRTIGIGPAGLALIARWLDRRTALALPTTGPLISDLQGRELSPDALRGVLKRLGRAAGIAKPVRPHGLRHSFAAIAARQGLHVVEIADLLGHASPATTFLYLKSLQTSAIVRAQSLDFN